ncbi:MAG: radical SAM protein [bacterium]
MKITLIRPDMGIRKKIWGIFSDNVEPLELATLAGLTPKEDEITLFDDRIEEIDYDHPADLVGITVIAHTARRAYQIAGQFRQRGVPVVMGGAHPSLLPQEASRYADAVVIGGAEDTWPQVLKDVKAHSLKPLYRASDLSDLKGLKPRRDIYEKGRYSPVSIVEFSRGCPHTCEFCSGAAFFQGKVRHRPVQDVIEEISSLSRSQFFFFSDDNLYAHKEASIELLKALIPLKRKWMAQIHLDFCKDETFMKLLAESGCIGVFIGFESLSSKNLKQMKKGGSMIQRYREGLARIRTYGFCIYGAFLFGYDEDREETFEKTLRFAVQERLFAAVFTPLQPFPGTPLYERLKSTGRLLYDSWWNDPDFHYHGFAFRPRYLHPESFDLCRKIQCSFYSYPSILRRALDSKTNARTMSSLLFFLAYNSIYRRLLKRNPWSETWQSW